MDDQREAERQKTVWPVIVCCRDTTVAGTIVDFSAIGARVVMAEPVYPGAYCTLKSSLFPSDMRGRVIWQSGCEIGLHFRPPRAARLPR